eukprot:scaffold6265_cov193-Cylindrotheca_fusiformis.AAC.26
MDRPRSRSPQGGPPMSRPESQRLQGLPHRDDPRTRLQNEGYLAPISSRSQADPRYESDIQQHPPRRMDSHDDQRKLGPVDAAFNDRGPQAWSSQQPPAPSTYSALAVPPKRNSWNDTQVRSPNPERRIAVPQGPSYQRTSSGDYPNSYPDARGPSSSEPRGGYAARGRGRGFRGGRGRGRFDSGGGFDSGRYSRSYDDSFQNTPSPREGSSHRSLDDNRTPYNDDNKGQEQIRSSGNFNNDNGNRLPQQQTAPASENSVDAGIKTQDEVIEKKQVVNQSVKQEVKAEEEPTEPRPLSPPPEVKPSGVMEALTRLVDLEAQLEYAYAKHVQLMKVHEDLKLQSNVLSKLPVGIDAIKEELEALET